MGETYGNVLLRRFWAEFQREKGLSETTIRKRDAVLGDLGQHHSLDSVTLEDLRTWLNSRHVGAKSRYTLISHLACFYRWAVAEEHVEANPTLRLARPKLPQRLPRPISEADYAMALVLAQDPIIRAMLLLGGMAGLRCCEMARLRWADVDLAAGTARLHGKGNRERVVPLHPAIMSHLADMARPTPWVLTSHPGAQRSPTAISLQLNFFLHGVASTSATAHQLRHRAATRVYGATHDLIATQRLLGHASVSTTQIYADLVDGALRDAVNAIDLPRFGLDRASSSKTL